MAGTSLWSTLAQQATGRPGTATPRLWAWLKDRLDLALYRPEAAPGVVARQLVGRNGPYTILKNPVTHTYYRLSERDAFLWERMDGSGTVKDLVVAYYMAYGSFAFSRVATLVDGLKAGLFLCEQPANVYWHIREQLQHRRPGARFGRFWDAFLETQFAVGGLDRLLTRIYRWGGWLLFTRPLLVLYVVVSLVGLFLFVQAFSGGGYGVVTIGGSYWLGVAGLIVANMGSIFVHEMAHALTVKRYGREVRRGGFMIYFGMPAFFVDTMDIWLEGKRARLAVTWAGPYSGLILGGLASIVISLWPGFGLNALLFQFAFLCYLTVFVNLNPLLELDGYFLLMDGLEIPMLRRRSLEFIRTGLWDRLEGLARLGLGVGRRFASLTREEWIFTVFGLLSAIWTAYAILTGAYFWQQRLAASVSNLWAQGNDLGRLALALGGVAISLPFALAIGLYFLGLARRGISAVARWVRSANTWHVAALLLVLSAALAWAPRYFGRPLLAPSLSLMALAGTGVLAWRNARDRAGARFALGFRLLALAALALMFDEAATLIFGGVAGPRLVRIASAGLGFLAYGAMLLFGATLFADTDLRALWAAEKALVATGLVVSYPLAVWAAAGGRAAGVEGAEAVLRVGGLLAPFLAATLLVPTLFSFWPTGSGPAWLALQLGLGGLAAATVFGLPPLLPYLLLACSLLLHTLATSRFDLASRAPEPSLEPSDRRRLGRAFGWTAAAVLAQFRQAAGSRAARALEERFNAYALAAGWPLSVVRGQVEDRVPLEAGLIERGEVTGAALSLLLDMVSQELGEKATVRALQRAYDGLPWEEREIGAQYLYRDVRRAEALSREFEASSRDQRALLRRMPLFATMDEAEIDLLRSSLRSEHYAPRQIVIRQGDPGDRFYIVERGHVEVTARDARGVSSVVNQLDRGDYFGELALLHEAPRNATCRVTVPTDLLFLSRADFDHLVKIRFALREKLDRSLARTEHLRRIPLFAELDTQQVKQIAAQLQEQTVEPGTAIIRQGEIGDSFYLIESGRVRVSALQDGEERLVAERGPGEYVGEIALLMDVPRTATVTALTETCLLTLHKTDFGRLVAEHLFVGRGLERETSRRMRDLQRVLPAA